MATFQEHVENEAETSTRGIGGIDLTFGHGVPIVSPVKGRISSVRNSPVSGKTTTIQYGFTEVLLAHQEELLIEPGTEVDRYTVIGREGATGTGSSGTSHVHLSVIGNAVFHDYNHNRTVGSAVKIFPSWNFVLDPDRLTSDGNPLVENPWNPAVDYDTPYLEFVEKHVRPSFARIYKNYKDTPPQYCIRNLSREPSMGSINCLWKQYEKIKYEGGPLEKELEIIRITVREAGKLIKLTSPYIDHTNSNIIRHVISRNPRHKDLILKYYDRFLKSA